jgi:hypothetical protein
VSTSTHYKFNVSGEWNRVTDLVPVDFTFQCQANICGPDVRFSIESNFVSQTQMKSQTDFFEKHHLRC